ncbi:hypothetical protein GCM10009545_12670 [Saccharopolyspora thermophila]|uniref:Uncharacterized protein n=1 Tax=Saccharopolyspora thermophila TaxID=89367 RepID=A0ABN1C6I3_9PSEU
MGEAGYPLSISTLSRYFSGKIVPSEGFLRVLHQTASADTGNAPGISIEDLIALRRAALARSTDRTRSSTPDRHTPGNDITPAAEFCAAHLPVGTLRSAQQDRQASPLMRQPPRDAADRVSAEEATAAILRLARNRRREDALMVVRELPETLGPVGSAMCAIELRRRAEHALADTLIGHFSRTRPAKEVIHFTLMLNRSGLVPEANKAMLVALRSASGGQSGRSWSASPAQLVRPSTFEQAPPPRQAAPL